jgi:hypothetical protein
MKTTKVETAKRLAAAKRLATAHSQVEPNLKRIHLIEPTNGQDPNAPIKLLEVVEGTLERGIEPIAFTPDPAHGIEYPWSSSRYRQENLKKYK